MENKRIIVIFSSINDKLLTKINKVSSKRKTRREGKTGEREGMDLRIREKIW